jgi:acetylglutamate kinase
VIVVKIGGEVVGSGEAALLGADLRELQAGRKIAIVHGGGPQATELQRSSGSRPCRSPGVA